MKVFKPVMTKHILIYLLSVIIVLCGSLAHGKDYIDYQRTFNRVDEDLLEEDYRTALLRLDSVYDSYTFIYAQHCFKAVQVCCKSGDSIRAAKWVEKGFIQGIPLWMIRNNELSRTVLEYENVSQVVNMFDSLHHVYIESIDTNLRKTIDSLIYTDQKFTGKVNDGFLPLRLTYHNIRWLKNNKRQFERLHQIIVEFGYPGEQLIGLPSIIDDSAYMIKDFLYYGPRLIERSAFTMLVHCYSNPRPDINDLLLLNVKLGNMPPREYGAINDFLAKWGRHKYGDYPYYNVWHTDLSESNAASIDQRRYLIGLNSYAQQRRNAEIWYKRRVNGSAGLEVVLEH